MHSSVFGEVPAEKVACRMTGSREAVSYGELEARSNQAAHLFRSLGLQRGDRIAFLLENHVRVFEIVWGAQRSGLIYTPISSRLTAGEIAYIVNDSGARLFIASALLPAGVQVQPLLHHSPLLFTVGAPHPAADSWEAQTARQPATPIDDEIAGSSMVYSSGTTGRPKGVRTELRNEPINALGPALLALRTMVGIGSDTVYLSPAPLYHAAPLRWNMLVQALGGTCLIMEQFDERAFLGTIDHDQVTHTQVVPTMFVRLLKLPEAERRRASVASLRRVVHAAAPCPANVKQQMIDWWGPILFEFYAATEGAGTTTISTAEWLAHRGSVGRSVDNPIHIVAEDGRECAPGEIGTIYFEGRRQFSYHNDEAKLAECVNERGWVTTGDIGYLDDQCYLYLTDRRAFMIISGGVNIYPQEIEDVLIGHPDVLDVAVFGVPNQEFGEEVKAVVQAVNPGAAGPLLAAQLSAWCRQHLSAIKCPKSIDFTAELPRHPNGKLYKRLLREPYWVGRGPSRIA